MGRKVISRGKSRKNTGQEIPGPFGGLREALREGELQGRPGPDLVEWSRFWEQFS